MPDDTLQYDKEKEALETLLGSKEFLDSMRFYAIIEAELQEYLDTLCLHDWRTESEENGYVRETCKKCKTERERYSNNSA